MLRLINGLVKMDVSENLATPIKSLYWILEVLMDGVSEVLTDGASKVLMDGWGNPHDESWCGKNCISNGFETFLPSSTRRVP